MNDTQVYAVYNFNKRLAIKTNYEQTKLNYEMYALEF